MTMRHLDEGTVQAYLDGELTGEATFAAMSHVAGCEACAATLAVAESDSALFAAAFAPDESIAVPSEILRARINAGVARLEDVEVAPPVSSNSWTLGALLAPFRNLPIFTPRHATAFAGLCAVLAFAVLFVVVERRPARNDVDGGQTIADAGRQTPAILPNEAPAESDAPRGGGDVESRAENSSNSSNSAVKVETAGLRGERKRKVAVVPRAVETPAVATETEMLLPVEKNYREAIASLTKAVEAGGDRIMNPKERFEYERNLALLDQAIAETRRVALRDPKDSDAVGFLISAYQSKVEMLTTVADQTQVAALGR